MNKMTKRILSLALSLGLLFQQAGFAQTAKELNMASYLSGIAPNLTQEKFRPLRLRYLSYNSLNDNFKLLLDKGDLKNLKTPELKNSTKTLLNYFLVGISLPDSMFWVNLRPDSEDQIINPYLEKTDVGKIMLEADLQLKKDTASFTSPSTPEGKVYWDRLYKKAGELYGYEPATIPTITRPWIVPGEIIIRESQDSAYVYKATLKVMLEDDYLTSLTSKTGLTNQTSLTDYTFKDSRLKALNAYSSQLIRELIIPKLTQELNSSKRYAALRQVYYSLILSRWFKLRFSGKAGTYASLINTKNLTNLTSQEVWLKADYFKQYQKSFADGEYNIKEPLYTPTGQVIRSYFSGGADLTAVPINNGVTNAREFSPAVLAGTGIVLEGSADSPISLQPSQDQAVAGSSPIQESPFTSAELYDLAKEGSTVLGRQELVGSPKQFLYILALGHRLFLVFDPLKNISNVSFFHSSRPDRSLDRSLPGDWMNKSPEAIITQLAVIVGQEEASASSPATKPGEASPVKDGQAGGSASSPVETSPFPSGYLFGLAGTLRERRAYRGTKEHSDPDFPGETYFSHYFLVSVYSNSYVYDLSILVRNRGFEPKSRISFSIGRGRYPILNRVIDGDWGETPWMDVIQKLGEVGEVVREEEESAGSSPLTNGPADEATGTVGGIDFRALPMSIQPIGNFKGLSFELPRLSQAALREISIDSEMQSIRNMVQSGMIPSGDRIKEIIAACVQKGKIASYADTILVCLVDILKLEEENASESSPELREALVIADSQG